MELKRLDNEELEIILGTLKEFGDRDHSTVINACNKIIEDMNSDPEFKELINDLIIELKS